MTRSTVNMPLQNMLREHDESIEILRQAFPDDSDDELYQKAFTLRTDRYKRGRYLTPDEIREQWPPLQHEW